MAYPTVSDLANYLGITSPDDHVELTDALTSAAREIDSYCGWGSGGFAPDSAATARVFVPESTHIALLRTSGFVSTNNLVVKTDTANDGTYDTTWASSDYELSPLNGRYGGVSGFPYWELRAVGDYLFPVNTGTARRATVQVTAEWGWSATPPEVTSAVLQRAAALHSRRHSYDGRDAATGFRAGGHDRDYELLLDHLRHPLVRPVMGFA